MEQSSGTGACTVQGNPVTELKRSLGEQSMGMVDGASTLELPPLECPVPPLVEAVPNKAKSEKFRV